MTPSFADLARQFCAWAERAPGKAPDELRMALVLLPPLYESAVCLPRGWPESLAPGLSEPPQIDREAVRQRFAVLPVRDYVTVADPLHAGSTTTVSASVASDLAEIYVDLKAGLWLYDAGQRDVAAAHWGDAFWARWGRSCVRALAPLHWRASQAGT
jgi:hypothetical protein